MSQRARAYHSEVMLACRVRINPHPFVLGHRSTRLDRSCSSSRLRGKKIPQLYDTSGVDMLVMSMAVGVLALTALVARIVSPGFFCERS